MALSKDATMNCMIQLKVVASTLKSKTIYPVAYIFVFTANFNERSGIQFWHLKIRVGFNIKIPSLTDEKDDCNLRQIKSDPTLYSSHLDSAILFLFLLLCDQFYSNTVSSFVSSFKYLN